VVNPYETLTPLPHNPQKRLFAFPGLYLAMHATHIAVSFVLCYHRNIQIRIVGSDAFFGTIVVAGEVFVAYAVWQLRSHRRRCSRLFWIADLTISVVMLLALLVFSL